MTILATNFEDMAEAVATVGLVASVIQISSFTKDVLDRYKALRSMTGTLPEVYRSVGFDLPVVLKAVARIKDQVSNNSLSQDDEVVIQDLIEACCANVHDLKEILTKVLPSSSASKWDKAALAVRSMRYEGDVRRAMASLDGHVQKLMFYQVSSLIVTTPPLNKSHLTSPPTQSCTDSNPSRGLSQLPEDLQVSKCDFSQQQALAPDRQQVLASQMSTMKLRSKGLQPGCKKPLATPSTCRWCLCPRFSSQRMSWRTRVTYKAFDAHRKGCPNYVQRGDGSTRCISLCHINKPLGVVIELALSVQFELGGISVSPKLALRGTCHGQSPIFHLLNRFPDLETSMDDPHGVHHLDTLLNCIRLVIDDGLASPFDVDEHGRTVFGVNDTQFS